MSRKKRRQNNAGEEPAVPEPAPAAGPELLRRYLLGLLTALIVARPFVLGEDPGILLALTDTSNLVLTLLWIVAAAGWASWRAWSGRGAWYGGLVEAGLLATVGLVFTGAASVARYKHPAQLIGWEWLVMFLALFLVRQLALTDEDRRGLLTAFLATVVVLSGYALYQSAVELPEKRQQLRASLEGHSKDRQQLGLLAVGPAGAVFREQARADRAAAELVQADLVARRVQINTRACSTFGQADSFAGYLVLLLPALAVAAFLRWRRQGAIPGLLTGACFVLAGAALWTALIPRNTGNLRDTWSAAWAMITDHPWLGVGAGNFGRLFPQYAASTIAEDAAEPHNFVLELGASYGVFALAAVLFALGAFFYLVLTRRPAEDDTPPAHGDEAPAEPSALDSAGASPSPETPSPVRRTRWEFYLGGMAGLLLGYFLREANQSADELLLSFARPTAAETIARALVAGGRSVLWFAVFALFETVPWTRRSMALALAAGVAALLIHLGIAGSISLPSVAQPLWLCVGLALGALHLPPRRFGIGLPGRVVPLPVAVGVLLAYFGEVFLPVSSSASGTWTSFANARYYREQAAKGFPDIANPPRFLWEYVLTPLSKAVDEDKQNSRRWCQLAHWFGEMWIVLGKYSPQRSGFTAKQRKEYGERALLAAARAQQLDPDGRDGYITQVSLCRSVFARRMPTVKDRMEHYKMAAKALQELVRITPNDSQSRFSLAEMLFASGQPGEGREAAREAQRLDQLTVRPQRQLRPTQRRQIEDWLKEPVRRP